MLYFLLFIIILFILLSFILNYTYLFILFLSLIYSLLFILSLKGSESVISDFCYRKSLDFFYKRDYILYSLILIIIPTYILTIKFRLFIVLHNIYIFFLKELTERNFISLNINIIIIILSFSNILIWIDIMNKKGKTGKYNKYSLFVALFLMFFLFYSIIISLTGCSINYLFLFNIVSSLTILIEILSFFINGDLILFNWLEKQFLPNLNNNVINFNWDELRNYITSFYSKKNIVFLSKETFHINKLFNNNNHYSYNEHKYKKNIYMGRNGNKFRRGIQFIFDLFILIREKLYITQYYTTLRIKYINNMKWGTLVSMFPLVNINDEDVKADALKEMYNSFFIDLSKNYQVALFAQEHKPWLLKYQKMIESPYSIRSNLSTDEVVNIISNYLQVRNSELGAWISVVKYIDKYQMEKLTILIDDMITQPTIIKILCKYSTDKDNTYINSVFYSQNNKEFLHIDIRAPKILVAVHVGQLYKELREYGFVLNSFLEHNSFLSEKIINENVYDQRYSLIINCVKDIEMVVFNYIKKAGKSGMWTKQEEETYNQYYIQYFSYLKERLNVRYKFIRFFLVSSDELKLQYKGKIPYLLTNLEGWDFDNKKIFKEIVEKNLNSLERDKIRIPYLNKNNIVKNNNIFRIGINPYQKWLNLSRSTTFPKLSNKE